LLAKRVITAVVLLAALLPAIFVASPWVWSALSLGFLTAAGFEWGRLLGAPLPIAAGRRVAPPPDAIGLAACLALVGIVALLLRERAPWPPAVLVGAMAILTGWWLVAGVGHLRRHEARSRGGALIPALLLLGCWIALDELRRIGPAALLSAMAVVWIADIAAYFAGRAFGRRKLAPAISPGKTWEGVAGAMLAVVLIGLMVAHLGGSTGLQAAWLPSVLVAGFGLAGAALTLVALVGLSIVGDLHESMLKRQAGVKDSGGTLPGHGGVLDRIDALIPTMPAVLLLHRLAA
jgi:phosphatidate cytidylyltransferase